MAPAAGLLAMRQPQCRHRGDRGEAVKAMPHDGILRAAAARAGATAGTPMTLSKRLEAGKTLRGVARSYNVSESTISGLPSG